MQIIKRNYVKFRSLSGFVKDSAVVGHDITSLSIRFGAFRRTGLTLFSKIQKSATSFLPTETEFFCGVFFGGVPPSSKIIRFYLLYECWNSVISVVIQAMSSRF
jgi:hypothetical protein